MIKTKWPSLLGLLVCVSIFHTLTKEGVKIALHFSQGGALTNDPKIVDNLQVAYVALRAVCRRVMTLDQEYWDSQ